MPSNQSATTFGLQSVTTITLEVARDTQAALDGVDHELVKYYRPGQPRMGLVVQIAQRIHQLQNIAERNRHNFPLAALSAVSEQITFPADIWPLADERWQDLDYPSFSAYITGLIRYDLLVGGPRTYSTGEVRSKVQRAITRKTVAARRKGGQRKILLEHLIERATGRRLPKEEMEKVKAQIAQTLRENLTKKP